MKVLIVVASLPEIDVFIKHYAYASENDMFFISPNCSGSLPDILITGVGMVQTVFYLTKILNDNKYDLILNAGIAGSFKGNLNLGQVVEVVFDTFSEIGAEDGDKFISVFEMGLISKDSFPYTNGKLHSDAKLEFKLEKLSGITVNKVHGNKINIERIISEFNPDVESMEGAAVFYVSLMNGVKCQHIRAISNYVEKRNKSNWNIPFAIDSLNNFLISYIENNEIIFKL
jgi:futalosine hydrolase